jgi:hypothetical protein
VRRYRCTALPEALGESEERCNSGLDETHEWWEAGAQSSIPLQSYRLEQFPAFFSLQQSQHRRENGICKRGKKTVNNHTEKKKGRKENSRNKEGGEERYLKRCM